MLADNCSNTWSKSDKRFLRWSNFALLMPSVQSSGNSADVMLLAALCALSHRSLKVLKRSVSLVIATLSPQHEMISMNGKSRECHLASRVFQAMVSGVGATNDYRASRFISAVMASSPM